MVQRASQLLAIVVALGLAVVVFNWCPLLLARCITAVVLVGSAAALYAYSASDPPQKSQQPHAALLTSESRSIKGIDGQPKDRDAWRQYVSSKAIEEAWDKLCSSIIQEFIYDAWFSPLSPDREFPAEVRWQLNNAFGQASRRARPVDWSSLIIREGSAAICSTLQLYRTAVQQIGVEAFSLLSLTDADAAIRATLIQSGGLHPAFSTQDGQYRVCRQLAAAVIPHLLAPEDHACPLVRSMFRELLCTCVIRSTLATLAPYSVNKMLLNAVAARSGRMPPQHTVSEATAAAAAAAEFERRAHLSYTLEVDAARPQPTPMSPKSPHEMNKSRIRARHSRGHIRRSRSMNDATTDGSGTCAAADMDSPKPHGGRCRETVGGATRIHVSGISIRHQGRIIKERVGAVKAAAQQLSLRKKCGSDPRLAARHDGCAPAEASTPPSSAASESPRSSTRTDLTFSSSPKFLAGSHRLVAHGTKALSATLGAVRAAASASMHAASEVASARESRSRTHTGTFSSPGSSRLHTMAALCSLGKNHLPVDMPCDGDPADWQEHSPVSAQVVAAEMENADGKECIVYRVHVSAGSREWSVTRRYRHFESLHKRLRDFTAYKDVLAALPPKRLLTARDAAFVAKRRDELDSYLQGLLSSPMMCSHPELQQFLSQDSCLYGMPAEAPSRVPGSYSSVQQGSPFAKALSWMSTEEGGFQRSMHTPVNQPLRQQEDYSNADEQLNSQEQLCMHSVLIKASDANTIATDGGYSRLSSKQAGKAPASSHAIGTSGSLGSRSLVASPRSHERRSTGPPARISNSSAAAAVDDDQAVLREHSWHPQLEHGRRSPSVGHGHQQQEAATGSHVPPLRHVRHLSMDMDRLPSPRLLPGRTVRPSSALSAANATSPLRAACREASGPVGQADLSPFVLQQQLHEARQQQQQEQLEPFYSVDPDFVAQQAVAVPPVPNLTPAPNKLLPQPSVVVSTEGPSRDKANSQIRQQSALQNASAQTHLAGASVLPAMHWLVQENIASTGCSRFHIKSSSTASSTAKEPIQDSSEHGIQWSTAQGALGSHGGSSSPAALQPALSSSQPSAGSTAGMYAATQAVFSPLKQHLQQTVAGATTALDAVTSSSWVPKQQRAGLHSTADFHATNSSYASSLADTTTETCVDPTAGAAGSNSCTQQAAAAPLESCSASLVSDLAPQDSLQENPKLAVPLYELISCVFELQNKGFVRRPVFNLVRQLSSLFAGGAIDDYLQRTLSKVLGEVSISRYLQRLQTMLWPGGMWFARAAAAARAASASAAGCSNGGSAANMPARAPPISMERYLDWTPPADCDEVAERVRQQLMAQTLPSAFVALIGRSAYYKSLGDVYGVLQSKTLMYHLGLTVVKSVLLALFPEIRLTVRQIQQG